MGSQKALRKARLHNRLRLLGIPLFLMGVAALVTAIVLVSQDRATWHLILWSVGATFTGLATFGNHHENAIAWMMQCEPGDLPPEYRKSLDEEMAHDKAETLGLKATPGLAAFVTVLALLLQFMADYKILQVL